MIRAAIANSSLGFVLVAASESGVCAVWMGDDPDELQRLFKDSFSTKEDVKFSSDSALAEVTEKVIARIERPSDVAKPLPLDLQGTPFQRKVWSALCEIPIGTTITYRDLAARIGSPAAVRAVAGACARNQVAIAIPCHRVVGSDGNLSGYRWGIARKEALLVREGARA
jgi:AraC family transcriptional regulator of adaptative response/methylated-DNA-[protein]-cysteine methyltransferase